nr:collagen alpha-1(I) chain-like [Cavia porcellus]
MTFRKSQPPFRLPLTQKKSLLKQRDQHCGKRKPSPKAELGRSRQAAPPASARPPGPHLPLVPQSPHHAAAAACAPGRRGIPGRGAGRLGRCPRGVARSLALRDLILPGRRAGGGSGLLPPAEGGCGEGSGRRGGRFLEGRALSSGGAGAPGHPGPRGSRDARGPTQRVRPVKTGVRGRERPRGSSAGLRAAGSRPPRACFWASRLQAPRTRHCALRTRKPRAEDLQTFSAALRQAYLQNLDPAPAQLPPGSFPDYLAPESLASPSCCRTARQMWMMVANR